VDFFLKVPLVFYSLNFNSSHVFFGVLMDFDKTFYLSVYRKIRLIRRFEETGMEKYREGRIHGYFHPYIGQEAIAVGVCAALRENDYVISTHRGHGHCIAKGADIRRMMAELYGKASGYSRGRGGSMHISDRVTGNIGANGIVGGGIPLAVGVGMGIRQEGSDRVVACFFGDGASNNGVFGESLNLAAIYRLPVIFILENNCYAATTHVRETALCEHLCERGTGYGVPGWSVYGNDPVKVHALAGEAIARARNDEGPSLIEAKTHRLLGHHVRDIGSYMPQEDLEFWRSRDPLLVAEEYLRQAGASKTEKATVDRDIEEEISTAVRFAEESSEPSVDEFLDEMKQYPDRAFL
jgi:TPP-dependent pyruvate/acetoin dehydrogenase alpha subunit